jgi:Family of unknown function (DUF6011)
VREVKWNLFCYCAIKLAVLPYHHTRRTTPEAQERSAMPAEPRRPMSDKQKAFIDRLLAERDVEAVNDNDYTRALAAASRDGQPFSARQASSLIDALLRAPKRRVEPRPADAPAWELETPAGLEPGIYVEHGEPGDAPVIYKVTKSRGTERLYATRLVEIGGTRLTEAGEHVRFEYQYEKGLIYRLSPAMRMTREEARHFGLRYGVCLRCGRFLKDATSVERAIGPVCWKWYAPAPPAEAPAEEWGHGPDWEG